jgi:trk system potassium uptake protein TrkH
MYIALFSLMLVLSVFLSLLCGVNTHSAFAASVSSLANVGPAIEELGTMGSFNGLPEPAKLIYTIDMFLGRIEIYPVLAVLSLAFSRKNR